MEKKNIIDEEWQTAPHKIQLSVREVNEVNNSLAELEFQLRMELEYRDADPTVLDQMISILEGVIDTLVNKIINSDE